MKFKIECDSPLLQYTLKFYLKNYLSDNGILITDNPKKNGIIIGKDIKKPFTKTSLILQLQKLSSKEKITLEEKIDKLCKEFKENLIKIIKEEYGKK